MEYNKEHLGKCAQCPKVKSCPFIGASYAIRAMTCHRLKDDKPRIDDLLEGGSPWLKDMVKDSFIYQYMKDKEKQEEQDLSKHYTPEAIELGKRKYDRRRKPATYLNREAKMSLIRRVCAN